MSFHFNLSSSSSEEDDDGGNDGSSHHEDNGSHEEDLIPVVSTSDEVAPAGKDLSLSSKTGSNSIVDAAPNHSSSSVGVSSSAGGADTRSGCVDERVQSNNEAESEDDDEEDDIDWEDAFSYNDQDDRQEEEEDEEEEHDSKLAATDSALATAVTNKMPMSLPTRGITIDFDAAESKTSDDDKNRKRKNKNRRVNKLRNLPPEIESLAISIHRSHMLTLTSRAIHISSCCSDEELLHVAHSLIPYRFFQGDTAMEENHDEEGSTRVMTRTKNYSQRGTNATMECRAKLKNDSAKLSDSTGTIPEERTVRELCSWFFDLVNRTRERRRRIREMNEAAGAPSRRRTRHQSGGTGRRFPSTRQRRRGQVRREHDETVDNEPSSSVSAKSSRTKKSVYEGAGITRSKQFLELCHYLSPANDDDPQQGQNETNHVSITPHEKAQLLVAVARSLGWRARYVTALCPIGKDLTVDHPLLGTNIKDIFQLVHENMSAFRNSGTVSSLRGKPGSRKRKHADTSNGYSNSDVIDLVGDDQGDSASPAGEGRRRKNSATKRCSNDLTSKLHVSSRDHPLNFSNELGWVEILCNRRKETQPPTQSQSTTVKKLLPTHWMHVDPEREYIDKPLMVEALLTCALQGDNDMGRRNSNTPVSYVLAVEHLSYDALSLYTHANKTSVKNGGNQKTRLGEKGDRTSDKVVSTGAYETETNMIVRLTDVTPRYANTWSQTLRLRGATGTQIASGGGKCVDIWWSDTIRKTNRSFQRRARHAAEKCKKDVCDLHTTNRKPKKSPKTVKVEKMQVEIRGDGADVCGRKTADVLVLDDSSDDERQNGKELIGSQKDALGDENAHLDDITARHEQDELLASTTREKIPTSKAAFKNHPLYVIPSVLNNQDVLAPDARKRICGVFKGELVYRRSDVSTAMVAKKWLYQGRKVRDDELGKPAKLVKARKKPTSKVFRPLRTYGVGESNDGSEEARKRDIAVASLPEEEYDGMDRLYGIWQTDEWSPAPVAPGDDIPVNDYKNVELELLNPGLVHLQEPRMSVVAKKLGIPYAPCLVGFEGHGGNGTPTIRGIVVHEHNTDLLREAHREWQSHVLEQENESRQKEIYQRWKRLIVGILTKDRLDREYG